MNVRTENRDGIAVITLDRPEVRNALDRQTRTELQGAIDESTGSDAIEAIVLTGSGDKAFCAGMDLKEFSEQPFAPGGDPEEGSHGTGLVDGDGISPPVQPKLMVAAVNGAALGAGFELVLSCDLVLAVPTAIFGFPEVKYGFTANGGGLIWLARSVAPAIALELALTGDPMEASRALSYGLVNKVVKPDRLLDEAIGLAKRVSRNPSHAVLAAKRLVRASIAWDNERAWRLNREIDGEIDEALAREGGVPGSVRRFLAGD